MHNPTTQHNLMQPETRAALRALAARRRRMLAARGVFAFVLTLLASMAVVAMIDRLVLLGQPARIALSLLAYAAAAGTLYFVSLRYLLRWPSDTELARLIEQAEPKLREDLVSAVELSTDGQGFDSPAFRAVLQRNVGKRIANVDPDRVLPWKMIAWWGAVSTGAVVLTLALLLVPGLRYSDMLARAMLPTADTDRVSTTRITLLSPDTDRDGKVPMNERVPVVVRVEGGSFDKVTLEVDRGAEGAEELRFLPTSQPNEFAIDLPINQSPLRFRVAAGDGLTRYFELDPTARPRITRAALTTTPPPYTGFEPIQTTGELGPISALAGSVVDLVLTTDQPIAKAQLRLDLAGDESVIALAVDPADPTRLRASVAIERSGDYHVYLVAKGTRFDTPDAQRHELVALADELPTVTLDRPTGTAGSARDALLRIVGSANDDVALARVDREIRVNGGDWTPTQVTLTNRGRINQPLDLMDLNLAVGDQVELRLAATDRADHTAYSESATLIVTPEGHRRLDAQALAAQAALLTALDLARGSANAYADAIDNYRQAQNQNANRTAQQQRLARATSAQRTLGDSHATSASRLNQALDLAVHGREADHLVRIGRLLGNPHDSDASTDLSTAEPKSLNAIIRVAREDAQRYEQAADLLRGMLTLATAESVDLQLVALRGALNRTRADVTTDHAIDPLLADQRLFRRTLGIVAQTRQARGGLTSAMRLDQGNGFQQLAERASDPLDEIMATIDALADTDAPADRQTLLAQLDGLDRAFEQSQRSVSRLLAQANRDAQQRYRRRQDELPLDATAIAELAKAPSADSAGWAAVDTQLARHAGYEERSPDADRVFLRDVSQALAALNEHHRSVETGLPESETHDKLADLANAHGTLERIHDLRVLRAMVLALAQSETARQDDAFAAFRHHGDWPAIQARFDDVARRLREVRELHDAARHVNEIPRQGDYRTVDREMDLRLRDDHRPVTREQELYAIAGQLDLALAQARPIEQQARQTVAEQTPSIPQRMRELAERAHRLSDESHAAAQRAEQDPSAQTQQDAAQLAQQQEQLNQQLDRLSQEIRRDADTEDLRTADGRDRSRDADDAIAMLQPDAERATEQLAEAQTLERADLQAEAIEQAADAQARSADTLRQLAEHFDNREQDPAAADQSRQALRDAEAELGIEEQLDQQYEQMERLAELAQADDADRLAQLEEMLADDPAMQRELDRLAQRAAEDAQQQIADAAAQEQQLAERLDERGQRADQQAQRQQQELERLAERAAELERDRVRPLENEVARDVPDAQDEVREARQTLRDAASQAKPDAQAAQDQGAPAEQQERTEAFARQTQQAAEDLEEAKEQAQQSRDEARRNAQMARDRADRGIRENEPDAQAAREIVEQGRAAENAEQVRRSAQSTEREAQQLANQAEQLANQARRQGEEREQDLGQAAQQQEQLAQQTAESAQDLARAARHQERLGDEQRARELQQQAQDVGELAQETLPQAAEQTSNASDHEQGEQAARDAAEALQQQAQRMNGEQGEQAQPGQPGEPAQGEPAEPGEQGQPGEHGQPQPGQPGEAQPGQAQPGQPAQGQPGEPGQPGQPQSAQPGQPAGTPAPIGSAVAEQLAQELDRLDQQRAESGQTQPGEGQPGESQPGERQPGEGQPGQGEPGQPGEAGQPGQPSAQPPRPIDRAAQQQAQQIRQQRNPNAPGNAEPQPGHPGQGEPNPAMAQNDAPPNGPGSPESNGAGPAPPGEQGQLGQAPDGSTNWGDLPPRMAEDLNQGARERAPADYLDQVDAYFRAIAERARQDANRNGGNE